jgi:serine/threonine-protein kinase
MSETNAPADGSRPVCPTCGAPAGIATDDFSAALTPAVDEMPPAPSPLPHAVARAAAELLANQDSGLGAPPVVGGYDLLTPLGRGGAALVFKARQRKTGRVVALKMVRGGAHAGPRDLARFRAEAQAVARLDHPHIVPLYDVGEQDGWAYFALEVAQGGSLARQLAGRPQAPAQAARLVQSLARAMHYAHERGIVHRDLKPANVLLTGDGVAKVSDFGLARRVEPEPDAKALLTRTGEILGTPSYMAPEQSWGRTSDIGPPADTYALGAILYECLTGRPPFLAATSVDTLLQVRTAVPIPPRRLVPSVPRDLETICLHCLHKEPCRRYPSAAALAEDLDRFVAGKPVHARPTPVLQKVMRWARRRKTATALMAVSAAAVVCLLLFGAWHYAQLKGYYAQLRTERNTADKMRELAQAKETEARDQKEETEKQWRRADLNFHQALAAVVQMLKRVSEDGDRLAYEPSLQGVRRRLLEDALRFCKDLLKQKESDPPARRETAAILLLTGDLHKQLAHLEDSEQAYRSAIRLYADLVADFPDRPVYRYELANCYTNLGGLLVNTPRQKEGEDAFEHALKLQQALVKEAPESSDYRSTLAGSYHNLGLLMLRTGRVEDGEKNLGRAVDYLKPLVADHPDNAFYRHDLARASNNFGKLLAVTNRTKEAETVYREALVLHEGLIKQYPRVINFKQDLAAAHDGLADVFADTRHFADAEAAYGTALGIKQRLVQDFPQVPGFRQDLSGTQYKLGRVFAATKRPAEAERAYLQALDCAQQLVAECPTVPQHYSNVGKAYSRLAELHLGQDRLEEARCDAEQAIKYQQDGLKLLPEDRDFQRSLTRHYWCLAETLLRLGDHAAAADVAVEASRNAAPNEPVHVYAAGVLARCVPLVRQNRTLGADKRDALALSYGDQAMTSLRLGLGSKPRPTAEQLRADPYFAPLRPRADFQKLVQELKATRSGAP